MKRRTSYFVYMVQCCKGTYYTGYTKDLHKRIQAHNQGRGAKYLRGRTPVRYVYALEFTTQQKAMQAEAALKKFSRRQKEALV